MKLILLAFLSTFGLTAKAGQNEIDIAEYERYIGRLMEEFHVPGLAVGVVNKSGGVYFKCFGVRGVEERQPVTSHTQFAIGSTTKAFTATALGILVDRGVLEWDDPVREFLPDFQLIDPVLTQLVTPRDLLTHRVGLPRHDLVWYGAPYTREDIFSKLRYLTTTAGFREKAQYQNMMYMTAGYLTGQLSNSSWEDFTRQNILRKIGMSNTTFSVTDMQASEDFAIPHTSVDGEIIQIPFRKIDAIGPAGSINSSIRDVGRWLRLQLNGGELDGVRVIAPSTLREIHKPQILSEMLGFSRVFDEFGTEHYSLGWFEQEYRHVKLIHHGGGIDGFVTFVGFLPEQELGIVVFGNTTSLVPYFAALGYIDLHLIGDIGPWEDRLRDLTRPRDPLPLPKTPPPIPLGMYTGTYTHPAYGEIQVSVEGNDLRIRHHSFEATMGHHRNNAFLGVDRNGDLDGHANPISFTVEAMRTVRSLRVKADAIAPPVEFSKVGKTRISAERIGAADSRGYHESAIWPLVLPKYQNQ